MEWKRTVMPAGGSSNGQGWLWRKAEEGVDHRVSVPVQSEHGLCGKDTLPYDQNSVVRLE